MARLLTGHIRVTAHGTARCGGRRAPLAAILVLVAVIGMPPLVAGMQEPEKPAAASNQAPAEVSDEQRPGSLPRQSGPFVPLTGKEKFRSYLKSLYSPVDFLGTAALAGINQARDAPPEWRQGMEGYGRRAAASYGRRVVKESIDRGIGGMIGYDPRYFPSERHGIWRRGVDAAIQVFRSRDDHGDWRVAYPHLIGAFASGLISRAWLPERYQTVPQGLQSGAITIGLGAAVNLLKEFW